MTTALDDLAAALAAPTDDEAAGLREAVAAAAAAGGGFVAHHLPASRRLFTAFVVGDLVPQWFLQPVADEAEARQVAEAHARDFVTGVQRLCQPAEAPRGRQRTRAWRRAH